MSDTHEVISAFLDDERFDSTVLVEALSEPAGRDLLIDLIALRHLAQTDGKDAHALNDHKSWCSSLRALAAVAAILVALVGGYLAGAHRNSVACLRRRLRRVSCRRRPHGRTCPRMR